MDKQIIVSTKTIVQIKWSKASFFIILVKWFKDFTLMNLQTVFLDLEFLWTSQILIDKISVRRRCGSVIKCVSNFVWSKLERFVSAFGQISIGVMQLDVIIYVQLVLLLLLHFFNWLPLLIFNKICSIPILIDTFANWKF